MSSCCSPDGACASNGETTTTVAVVDSTATVYRVSGMSCGHCRTAITASVGALAGVL
ncbi:copper-binding protein, partial [Streptomyces sp. RSD-27]